MERQHEPELVSVRNQLLGLERNRLHGHRHDLFWNGSQWQATFKHLVECEQRRDNEYLQTIALVPAGNAESLWWLQALYDAIEHDMNWHQWLLGEVQVKQQSAEQQALLQHTQQELLDHEALVTTWLRAREVRLNQVALEYLEGRRREEGSLTSGVWERYWAQLQQATQLQSQYWQQGNAQALSHLDLTLGVGWYKHLRDMQESTYQLWRTERRFDRKSWQRDRAQVDQAIRLLEPRQRLFGAWLIVVAIGFAAFYFVNPFTDKTSKPERISEAPTTPMTFLGGAAEINEQGLNLLVRGDCTAAMPLFQRAAELDPTFYQPPNNLAFCLFDQGNVADAITQWRKSVQLNSANADGHAGLAMALYHTGLIAEGQTEYQTAIRINPKYGDETWLRNVAKWSEQAVAASRPLRLQATR